MEKVTIYRLSNGMEVAGESVATLETTDHRYC